MSTKKEQPLRETEWLVVKSLSQPHPLQKRGSGFLPRRDVAQPGRALAWGARGRQFKSARPDHYFYRASLQIVYKI